jgi:hypothetical protein
MSLTDDELLAMRKQAVAVIKRGHWPPSFFDRATAVIDELLAARKALADREWQPIETCPKDGTPILAVFIEDREPPGEMVVVRYIDAPLAHSNYPWSAVEGHAYHREAFILWQPLPSPPVKETPDAE